MAKKEKVEEKLEFKNVHAALGYIQVNLSCPKSQTAKIPGKYSYNYRNTEDIMEALKPLLKITKTHLTFPKDHVLLLGDKIYVCTIARLHHFPSETKVDASSQAREPENSRMDAPQATGSTSSYARKYALGGLFAIDDTKDADFYDNSKSTPVKKTTDTPGETWKPKGLPPAPLGESKIPEPNVEIMEQKNPPVFDFSKK